MKPYEHYLEAERLLAQVADTDITNSWETEMIIARASVHAQLAQSPLGDQEHLIDLNNIAGYTVTTAPDETMHFHPANVKIHLKSGYLKE